MKHTWSPWRRPGLSSGVEHELQHALALASRLASARAIPECEQPAITQVVFSMDQVPDNTQDTDKSRRTGTQGPHSRRLVSCYDLGLGLSSQAQDCARFVGYG